MDVKTRPPCPCGADLKVIEVDSSRGIEIVGKRFEVRVEWTCLNEHQFVEFLPREEADALLRQVVAA